MDLDLPSIDRKVQLVIGTRAVSLSEDGELPARGIDLDDRLDGPFRVSVKNAVGEAYSLVRSAL
jgi:hypothetical protein